MNKLAILIILNLILLSCSTKKSSNDKSNTKEELPVAIDTMIKDISGKWYLTHYTDSTIINKKIYDYYKSYPICSYAYEISFEQKDPDSCVFKGFHEWWTLPLTKISQNKYKAGEDDQYWILTFIKSNNIFMLHAKEFIDSNSSQKADPRTYKFYKKDLQINNEELYFAKNLFKGEYYDSTTKRKLVLNEDLMLQGWDSANKYSILIDDEDFVPSSMDAITFYNSDNSFRVTYNWKFVNSTLILSDVINYYNDGSKISTNTNGDYVNSKVGQVAHRLIKIK